MFLKLKISLHLETDSYTLFQIIRRMTMENQAHLSLLMDIRALLNELENCWIGFNFWEANKVADRLANFGRENPLGLW